MTKSRYENAHITSVKGRDFITSLNANINRPIPINKIKTKIIKYDGSTRLDQLAHEHLGSSQYWWVIAKINNLYGHFWRIEKGAKLLIPENVNDVLEYF